MNILYNYYRKLVNNILPLCKRTGTNLFDMLSRAFLYIYQYSIKTFHNIVNILYGLSKRFIPIFKEYTINITGKISRTVKNGYKNILEYSKLLSSLFFRIIRKFSSFSKEAGIAFFIGLSEISKFLYKLLITTSRFLFKYLLIISIQIKILLKYSLSTTRKFLTLIYEFSRKKWVIISKKTDLYINLTRLNKPIGIMLLLWPTLWALWFAAEGIPDNWVLIIFISGVILMRSAGCTINDLADRNLDLHINRTKDRLIASGKISVTEGILLATCLILLSFCLVLTLDIMTIQLSLVALILATIYPFTKRFTYLPQFFLGLAFAWAVPMAFSAQSGEITSVTWLLLIAAILWAMAYDTMYAMVDREDDLKTGIKSTAILFEDADRLLIGIIQFLVIITLIFIGIRMNMGWIFYTGLSFGVLFLIYQQFLIRERNPEKCFQAFLNNNWFGAVIFVGIFFQYLER